MHLSKAVLIAICLFISFANGKHSKMKHHGCNKTLIDTAKAMMDFTQCSMKNGVPMRVCTKCRKLYKEAVKWYKELKAPNCSSIYIGVDKLDAIKTVADNSLEIWEKAVCSECVSNPNNINNITNEFNDLISCINLYMTSEKICINCKEKYLALNNLYEEISLGNNKICFEIVDMMNKSRSDWSKKYGCCARQGNLITFSIWSLLLGSIPIIFYVSMAIYVRNRERLYTMTDAELNRENPTICANNEPIEPSIPSSSTSHLALEHSRPISTSQLELDKPSSSCLPISLSSNLEPSKSAACTKENSLSDEENNMDSDDEKIIIGPSTSFTHQVNIENIRDDDVL